MLKGMKFLHFTRLKAIYLVSFVCILTTLLAALYFYMLCDLFNGCQHLTEGTREQIHSIYLPDSFKQPGKFALNNIIIRPEQIPDKLLFLVIISSSSLDPIGQARRDAIRKTWGNCAGTWLRYSLVGAKFVESTNADANKRNKVYEYKGCRLIFYLGITKDSNLNEQIRQEASKHGDILVTDVAESYKNLTWKLRTCLGHVAGFKTSPKYVVKVDNDVHANLPNLAEYLIKNRDLPNYLYGGKPKYDDIVIRDRSSKWYIPEEDYSETVYFPAYCMGLMYVLSGNVVDPLVKALTHVKPISTDDCYIGIALKKIGVTPVKINNIDRYWHRSTVLEFLQVCDFPYFIGFGDSLLPSELFEIEKIIALSNSFPSWYCWNFSLKESFLSLFFCIILYISIVRGSCMFCR